MSHARFHEPEVHNQNSHGSAHLRRLASWRTIRHSRIMVWCDASSEAAAMSGQRPACYGLRNNRRWRKRSPRNQIAIRLWLARVDFAKHAGASQAEGNAEACE